MRDLADVDLRGIVLGIFDTVLGLPLQDRDGAEAGGMLVTGCVHLTGDWHGSVTVECSEPLARRATAAMFMTTEDAVTDEEMRDVVGELANMCGGNLKSALGGSCRLSLPSVTRGLNARITVPGTVVADQLAFSAAGESLVVTALAKQRAIPTIAEGEVAAVPADR